MVEVAPLLVTSPSDRASSQGLLKAAESLWGWRPGVWVRPSPHWREHSDPRCRGISAPQSVHHVGAAGPRVRPHQRGLQRARDDVRSQSRAGIGVVSGFSLHSPWMWCWTFQWVFFLQKGVRALAGTSLPGEGWSPLPAPGCCCLLSAKPVPQLGCLPQSDVGAQRAWPGPCLVVSAP